MSNIVYRSLFKLALLCDRFVTWMFIWLSRSNGNVLHFPIWSHFLLNSSVDVMYPWLFIYQGASSIVGFRLKSLYNFNIWSRCCSPDLDLVCPDSFRITSYNSNLLSIFNVEFLLGSQYRPFIFKFICVLFALKFFFQVSP